MNGHKSSSIFGCFLAFFVLMAAGCAPIDKVYTVKRYGNLHPTVKEAMVVKLRATENEMVNSGISINEGDPYSIVAAGYANVPMEGRANRLIFSEDFSLEFRIGQKPSFTPLSGTFYSLNGTTRIAHANGNLYLALDCYRNLWPGKVGDVDVLIIVWKTDDMAQIVGFLQTLREDANKFSAHTDFINGFDDAIDRAEQLR